MENPENLTEGQRKLLEAILNDPDQAVITGMWPDPDTQALIDAGCLEFSGSMFGARKVKVWRLKSLG